ncbi:MAG TPA: sigma-70 family RNA polymerase sigma factor [Candidatus Koribacter sp.]|jgi:RNA polymerase sigma-70 factor (ECF subfamily)
MAFDPENPAQKLHLAPTQHDSASDQPSDSALVDAARSGDRASFGILYQRYARMVHGVLLSRVPPAATDDLVQDVFIQALRRLTTLRDGSRFGGWIAAIARNRATDYFRQAPPEVPLAAEDAEDIASASVDRGEAEAVLSALQRLPGAYRETLILRLVEGMSGPEIAARTGLTPGSVRVNLHRGMQQLRQALGLKEKP